MSEQHAGVVLVGVLALASAQGRVDAQTKQLPLPGEVFATGGCTAFVIEPPESARRAGPMPWVWYAPTLKRLPGGAEKWMFERFLAAGIAIAGIDVGESYGSPRGRKSYQALYEELTTTRGYGKKPVLLARSRGGLMLYSWAAEHPESVGGIAGIYPVCDIASYPGVARAAPAYEMTTDELDAKLGEHNPIDRLAPLARAKVPILHIHGDRDATVPLSANSEALRERYAAHGGPVQIRVVKGQGHDMWRGWFESRELTDFAIDHALGRAYESQQTRVISSIGSERATQGHGNKIVTLNGKTHVVWQEITRTGYPNCVATYDHATRRWAEKTVLNVGVDNHARPVIAIDQAGYLHVVLSGHDTRVTYRRSSRANDSSEWTDEVGIAHGTYPVLICGSDRTLYLTMWHGKKEGVVFFRKTADGAWRGSQLISRPPAYRDKYAAYPMSLVMDANGTLHLVAGFYEGKSPKGNWGHHQAQCYMRSRDGGVTWERANGQGVRLPARPEHMDVLFREVGERPEETSAIERLAAGIVVDERRRPHVFSIWHGREAGQIVHSTIDASGAWHDAIRPELRDAFPARRATRGMVTHASGGRLYLLVELSGYEGDYRDLWFERRLPKRALRFSSASHKRCAWLYSTDGGKTFAVKTAVPEGDVFHCSTMEKSTGANRIPAGCFPAMMYFDGNSGYPGSGQRYYTKPVSEILASGGFSENRVFFVHARR